MKLHLAFPPLLMSQEVAAYYLDVSIAQLNELQKKSVLIPRANGGKRGFLRSDLDAYAESLPDWEGRKATK